MLDVTLKNLRIFTLCAAFAMSGCKDPEVSVSPLGKKLPAPSLKGTSPFDQSFSSQGYVQVQGSCDSRIGNISLSLDDVNWSTPPANPDLTGATLPANTTNDINCSDGSFNVYLTKNDLINIWKMDPNANNPVQYIFIKGETLIGDSEVLIIPNKSPGNNSPDRVAAKIGLEKVWPRGFAGSGICENFRVMLLNSSGYSGALSTSDVLFNIEMSQSGTSYGSISAFSSMQDCDSGTNAQTQFKIPAGVSEINVIYRFPSGPLDATLNFRVINPSSLTADANYTAVVLRDSTSTTNRFLVVESPLYQIYKDTCYPATIRSYKYNKTLAADSSGGTINFSSTDNQLQFYTSADCSVQTTSYTFAASSSELPIFIKYNSAPTDTVSFKSVSFSMAGATGSVGTLHYDSTPETVRIDLTSSNVATKLDMWGPNNINNGSCQPYRLVSYNNNGTPLPVSAATNVALSTVESSVGAYYSDQTCSSGAISSTSLAANSFSTVIYFKPDVSAAGTYHLAPSSSTMSGYQRDVFVNLVPTRFNVMVPDVSYSSGICKAVNVELTDGSGRYYSALSDITTGVTVNLNTYNVTLYSDPSCSMVKSSSDVTILSGSSLGTVYFKIDATSVGKGFNVYVNPVGGLIGATFSGSIQN